MAFNSYPESSSTKKQQEHGVSKPAVQLIVTRHRQSQQIWAVLSSKLALENVHWMYKKAINKPMYKDTENIERRYGISNLLIKD